MNPTEIVRLWFDNDEDWYHEVDDLAAIALKEYGSDRATRKLADAIQELVEEGQPEGLGTGVYADLLGYALADVEWDDIAEAFLEPYLDDDPEDFQNEEDDDPFDDLPGEPPEFPDGEFPNGERFKRNLDLCVDCNEPYFFCRCGR